MTAESPLRWGCIGTGNIAMAMAQQLSRLPGAKREAICSASGKPASTVEHTYGYARVLTLEELVSDPAIDIVYVASANTAHAKHCLAALQGMKHVLCEKPMTMNFAEAKEVLAEAERRQLLLVDGSFSAYLPAFDILRAHLPDIGKIQRVELNKKIRMVIMENSPIINLKALGGGLYDGCGSYTAHALCFLFGADAVAALRPENVLVESDPSPNGQVDYNTKVTLQLCGVTAILNHRASDEGRKSFVTGELGSIEFTLPRLEEVIVNGKVCKTPYGIEEPFRDLSKDEPGAPHGVHTGLGVEAAVVQRAVAAGVRGPGTPELSLEVMIAMAHLMDLVRQCIPTHLNYKATSNC